MTGKTTSNAVLSSALILAGLAAVCAALVAMTYDVTEERIEDNRQRFLEESLAPMLEGIEYEGKLSDSTVSIAAPHDLPGNDDVTVYRVFADGRPVAAIFSVSARDGYAGIIRLLVGISAEGTVNRVRVLEHRETPGLGDRIESTKSDWMERFNGRSIGDPSLEDWKIRRDGGEFDQLSGASITSRAVVRAVRETLVYFEANAETVFAAPAGDEA